MTQWQENCPGTIIPNVNLPPASPGAAVITVQTDLLTRQMAILQAVKDLQNQTKLCKWGCIGATQAAAMH